MVDQKKVIIGVECHRKKMVCMIHCPYCDGTGSTEQCIYNLLTDVQELLKEKDGIIEQYHKADTFLNVHGWKWE